MQEAKLKTGVHELSLLAKLIKPNDAKASNFKLNLFGDGAVHATPKSGEALSISLTAPVGKP